LTLLTYVWQAASAWELAVLRAATDSWSAPLAAAQVGTRPANRTPRALWDVNFFVHERSLRRLDSPRAFLDADLAFHRSMAASLRGMEIASVLYRHVGERLIAPLMAVADVQAGDEELDAAHHRLSEAVLAGDVRGAARGARHIALEELASLQLTLG
jgi:DNA-binding FadR family transcriptional regulator